MNLCCGELNLDDNQIDRELEEVWVRQRYRCLESKKPRKVLMEEQAAEEEQLITKNHRRGFMKGKKHNNKNIRGRSVDRIRYEDARRKHIVQRNGVRSSSVPKASPSRRVANGLQNPQKQMRGRNSSVQNKTYGSKMSRVQPSVTRSWSLDSRRDGDVRVRSNSPAGVRVRRVNHSSSDNRRQGINLNVVEAGNTTRGHYNTRTTNVLPPRPQLNVLQKRRAELDNRRTDNYLVARNGGQTNPTRNGYHMNQMEESQYRAAANPRFQYLDNRDDSRSWSSNDGSSDEEGMGLLNLFW